MGSAVKSIAASTCFKKSLLLHSSACRSVQLTQNTRNSTDEVTALLTLLPGRALAARSECWHQERQPGQHCLSYTSPHRAAAPGPVTGTGGITRWICGHFGPVHQAMSVQQKSFIELLQGSERYLRALSLSVIKRLGTTKCNSQLRHCKNAVQGLTPQPHRQGGHEAEERCSRAHLQSSA